MQKFVVDKDDNSQTVNAWYRICQDKQLPYIIIEKRTKYATVRWDYFSYTKENEEKIIDNQNIYVEELEAIFQKYRNPKSKPRIDGFGLVYYFDIEVEKAPALAEELYDIVVKIVG
ncbi:hypothetical protein [Massilia sp.]|uniref:hypothetical protein n=1 Tax=Massilia sp. TaxID=1882437 RepID=UPI0028A12627|nr:hypothetical protein [Massilia sp.]